MTKYFWRLYYWLRPVGVTESKSAFIAAACRVNGWQMKKVKLAKPKATDYTGLGWAGALRAKVCAEASCNNLYVPDQTGKCPKCGSEGIWINGTVIGNLGSAPLRGAKRKGELKWEE